MGSRSSSIILFSVLLLFIVSPTVLSWKREEFRSCDQTPFCKRARSRPPGACTLIARDVSVSDGEITAKLVNRTNPDHHSLILKISIYQSGIFRVKIHEDPTLTPHKTRFQVPDVVVPEFEDTKLWLQRVTQDTIGGDLVASSVIYLGDGNEVVLRHEPFEIFTRKRGSSSRVIGMNTHQMFDYEVLRSKEEGEDWEERFRGHTDKRPYGPQSISFDVSFFNSEFVAGIPEHATSVALKPTRGPGVDDSEPYRLFNLDVFEYLHESPFGLYGSIPFMMSMGKGGQSAGFFWLNAAEMQIDVLAEGWDAESAILLPSAQKRIDTFWMSEAGIVDVFFFTGNGPKDVVSQYVSLSGKPAMPQHFATAYHQCRWNYKDEEDVRTVDSKFDENDLPYDVLWLDIEHTDGKKYFTWDPTFFPHPEEMQKRLSDKGRHMVTIVDPHVKRDDSYWLHKQATEKGYYVKDSNGNDFDGWCWPGASSYLDMLNPQIRSWWHDKFSYKNYVGSTPSLYIWNDMNEPSVFNGPEVTMPRDAIHYGNTEHREVHNANGYYFHMATSDGLLKRGEGRDRPFVLSRAFFSGSQRYGAVWTGDNTADWDHLRVSVPMVLTLGLSGISFTGADVGGFFGNPETDLLVRWYQLGAFYPFFRAHGHLDTKRREPYLFGDRVTELIREAIHDRYMLLPYFYTLFREANVTGVPLMRPLWMEYPNDESTFKNDEAFMLGTALLVQGVFAKQITHTSVYLPGTEPWYDFKLGTPFQAGKPHLVKVSEESIPVFQKGGTIIPRKDRRRRSSTQMLHDPYTLVVALNSSLAAEGELYIDDGKSFEFRRGAFIHRRFVFAGGVLSSMTVAPSRYSADNVIERIILLGISSAKAALVEPANEKVSVEIGLMTLNGRLKSSVPTIRKPGVKISEDWSIRIL